MYRQQMRKIFLIRVKSHCLSVFKKKFAFFRNKYQESSQHHLVNCFKHPQYRYMALSSGWNLGKKMALWPAAVITSSSQHNCAKKSGWFAINLLAQQDW